MTTKTERELDNAVARLEPEAKVPVTMQAKGGLQLTNLDEAIRFAQGIIQGGMAPRGLDKPGAVVALIQAGMEIGLSPMFSLSNLTFTNGRLGIMGDAAKAVVRAAHVLADGTDIETTMTGEPGTLERTATVTTIRKGQKEACATSFSANDAATARLLKQQQDKTLVGLKRDGSPAPASPWTRYQDRMLAYRAWGFHFRDYFSDVGFGLVVAEELGDYPTIPRVNVSGVELERPSGPDPLLVAATVSPPGDAPAEEPATNEETPDVPDTGGDGPLSGDPAAPESPEGHEPMDVGVPGPMTATEVAASRPETDPETGEEVPADLPRLPGFEEEN